MSFFGTLKRAMMGQPLFDDQQNQPSIDPNATEQRPANPVPTSGPAVRKGDDRTFPKVYVKRTGTRINGNNMAVYCRVQNDSPFQIVVDRIRACGGERRIAANLRPGEEHEYLAYSGPRLRSQQYRQAFLDYRTADGDYFESIHDVRFDYHADTKTYSIDELRLHLPIRDIYG